MSLTLRCKRCGRQGIDVRPVPHPSKELYECTDDYTCRETRKWRRFAEKRKKERSRKKS